MMKMESESPERYHVISVLVENEFGVLARIAGMFAARGFNIESLSVGATHDETVSRMTIVVKGTTVQVDQVRKQLSKQLEVIAIQDLTESASFVEREMMLVKVKCTEQSRGDLLTVATLFKAEAIDCTTESITLQLVDNSAKLTNFVDFLQPFGIMEVARSGVCALNRGVGGLQTSFLQKVRETLDRHQTEIV
ncbi:MAG: acetolactate synthase small subunit [Candidatus Sumerlaeia bacterium]|nr:acetolactate synthase small subunit [Candidatus Sumerlaeia bacterium]